MVDKVIKVKKYRNKYVECSSTIIIKSISSSLEFNIEKKKEKKRAKHFIQDRESLTVKKE